MSLRGFKKTLAALAAVLMLLSLAGCGKESAPDISSYVLETEYREGFRVLQLTDSHLGNKDNRRLHYDFMELTIDDADPDLIILTGDLFTFADKALVREFFGWIDSFGVPWAVTFGNHDEQCYFSIDWLTSYLNSYGSNCLFIDIQDDDVYGNANYAINLTSGGKTVRQLILMDSNRYYFGNYKGYDWIKWDQIDWYEKLAEYTADENGGDVVPSSLFIHIPLPEYAEAIELCNAGSEDAELIFGTLQEGVSSPEYNSGFFDVIEETGSTDSIFAGHDHLNNVLIRYKGIYLSYGLNSTDRIYCDPEMMGGQLIEYYTGKDPIVTPIYHSYSEVENND